MIRQKQMVKIWVRGQWKLTEAYVIESDLCTNPDCIKKLPSPRSLAKSIKGIKKGYCSVECFAYHKELKKINPNQRALNDYI